MNAGTKLKRFTSIALVGILIAALIGTIVPFVGAANESSEDPPEWWNASWSYLADILITDRSGTDLTDFQVKVVVDYEPNMKPNFDDIRFITSDHSTEIPFWREDYEQGIFAEFWVKVPSIPASDTAKIKMYYGNPSVTTTSNIQETFIWGDDFEDIILTSEHTRQANYGYALQYVQDGEYHMSGMPGSVAIAEICDAEELKTFPDSYVAESNIKGIVKSGVASISPKYESISNRYDSSMDIQWDCVGLSKTVDTNWSLMQCTDLAEPVEVGDWQRLATSILSDTQNNTVMVYGEDVPYVEYTDPDLSNSGLAFMAFDWNDHFHIVYDDFRVRQYVPSNPDVTIAPTRINRPQSQESSTSSVEDAIDISNLVVTPPCASQASSPEMTAYGAANQNSLPTIERSPRNGATNVSLGTTLLWNIEQNTGDDVTYDVHFGTRKYPPLVIHDSATTAYRPIIMTPNTKYYWKIVSRDSDGMLYRSETWSFTTEPRISQPSSNQCDYPTSGNCTVDIPADTNLEWHIEPTTDGTSPCDQLEFQEILPLAPDTTPPAEEEPAPQEVNPPNNEIETPPIDDNARPEDQIGGSNQGDNNVLIVNDFIVQYGNANLNAIGNTKYDLVIMDDSSIGSNSSQIEALKHSPGGEKLVIAYLCPTMASNYRYYWQSHWTPGAPDWLGPISAWAGSYWVKYWDKEWQNIMFGSPNAYLDSLMEQGFDGVFLDVVDAYWMWPARATAKQDMGDFIASMTEYARKTNPNFIVLANGGDGLYDHPGFVASVTGVVKESVYYGYSGDNTPTPSYATSYVEANLDRFIAAGNMVFIIDFTQTQMQIDDVYQRAQSKGYVALCTVSSLDRLTINPGHEPD
ncbi:MAG: DUF2341 domain-containing protein [Chloroflexota bacterium]|nr:DUF2341 domain-containing protein [Chloroflexota bacterium]